MDESALEIVFEKKGKSGKITLDFFDKAERKLLFDKVEANYKSFN